MSGVGGSPMERWRRELHPGSHSSRRKEKNGNDQGKGETNWSLFPRNPLHRETLSGFNTGQEKERGAKRWSAPIPVWRLQGLEEMSGAVARAAATDTSQAGSP